MLTLLRHITLIAGLVLGGLDWQLTASAQTITTGTVPTTSFCPNTSTPVSVSFSTTGAFGTGTVFTAQLSNATGSFATPVSLGTLTASPASATTLSVAGTIPATTPAGSGYQVRVVSATPASGTTTPASSVIGSVSPTTLIGSQPAAPVVSGGTGPYCQNATPATVVASGQNLTYYTATGQVIAGFTVSTTAPGTFTYAVSQTVGGCESPKTPFTILINAAPAAPAVTSPVVLCQGATAQPLIATPLPSTNTLRWYGTAATGGTAATTAPTPGNQASDTYYVSQVDGGGCESIRAAITLTVNALPGGPNTAPTVTLCQNSVALPLTATGQNVQWYDQTGAALSVAPTPSTTTPGTATYTAGQTVNGCQTPVANRSSVVVTVNTVPGPPTVGGAVAYCVGDTPAPVVAAPALGATLIWYGVSATGGTGSPVAPTPSTAAANGGTTTNYYVSQTLNGCESTRASIAVIIKVLSGQPTVSPVVVCQNATPPATLATPTASATLNWYGTNATGGTASAIAPTISTSSPTSYNLYVSQTLNACEGPRTAISVTVNALPGGPTVTPTVTLCQNTAASPLTATGQGVQWYDQTGAALSVAPTPSTTTPGTVTYTAGQTVNGCQTPVANRSSVVVTVTPAPTPPTVGGAVAYCVGDTPAPVVATPALGATLIWYGVSATGGTGSSVAPTPSTAAANGGTTTNYYVSQTLNGCESTRASIAVTIRALPSQPTVSPVVVCQGATAQPLAATPSPSTNTLRWYGTAATGGTAATTAPTPGNQTSATYYVSQVDGGGCESIRAAITVTINALPGGPNTAPTVTLCQNTAASPLTATGQGVQWYDQTGTTLSVAPTPSTTTPGTVTYTAGQTVNGCQTPVANRSSVVVTITPAPTPPTVGGAVAYCVGDTPAPVSATSSAGATLIWYGLSATGGTGSAVAPTPSTGAANGGTTITYYVAQTLNGCESTRSAIVFTVKALPGQPTVSPVVVCQNATPPATLATPTAGATLNWYGTSPTSGTASGTAPTVSTSSPTAYTLYVSQTLNGCEGPRGLIPVTVNALPGTPTVSASFSVCQGSNPFALSASGVGSIKWYDPSGVFVSGIPVPSTTNAGSFTYTVGQVVNNCETPAAQRGEVVVTVAPTPGAPTVVSGLSYCVGVAASALSATPAGAATLLWYGRSATGGTASSTPTVPATTTNESGQTINYYVSQLLVACESPRSVITVQVKPTPNLPTGGAVEVCQGAAPVSLIVNITTSGASLVWYGQNATGGTASPVTPSVSTGTPGVFSYYVAQNLNGCESPGRTVTTIEVKPTPAQPGVTPVFYCQRQQDQPAQVVLPFTATGQNLQWYNLDGNKYGAAPSVGIDNPSVTTVQVTQTLRGCESGKATATITVQNTPTPVPTPASVVYCRSDRAVPLTASTVVGGSLRWIDPYGTLTADAPTPITLNSTPAGGVFFYVYQIGGNGCYSARATVQLTVNTVPTLSIFGPSTPVNLGLPATLKLRFTSIPPFSYTLNDGKTGVSQDTVTTISVMPARTFIYQVASVSNVCGIGLPGNPATATVTVISPIITTGAVAATICAGGSLTVPFTTSGSFNPGNLFKVQLADTVSKQFVDLATVPNVGTVSVTIPTTFVGGPSFVRVVGTNPGIQVNGSNTLLNVRPRPVATLSGTQDIYQGGSATLSISLTGDGPWSLVYTDSLRIIPITATVSPFLIQAVPAQNTTYRLQSVSNGCGVGTVTGSATVRVLTPLGLTNPLNESVKAYPIPTSDRLTVIVDQLVVANGVTLTVTDIWGQTWVVQNTKATRTDLNLSSLAVGMYFLRVQVGDQYIVRKIMRD